MQEHFSLQHDRLARYTIVSIGVLKRLSPYVHGCTTKPMLFKDAIVMQFKLDSIRVYIAPHNGTILIVNNNSRPSNFHIANVRTRNLF